MLKLKDIHELNYSPDLSSTGIDYVLAALDSSKYSSEGIDFNFIRECVAEKAVELAFRRYLGEREVPHDLLKRKDFGSGEQQGIQIGGRRCKIVNQLISQRKDIRLVHSNLKHLLNSEVMLSQVEHESQNSDEDIYLFTAITGLVTRSLSEVKKSIQAEQVSHLIYQFPQAWSQPSLWKDLGPVVFKGDSQDLHRIDLTGQNQKHQTLKTNFDLPIKERLEIEESFYSLRQMKIDSLPSGAIGVHSPGLQDTLLIAPYQWGNLWIHGLKIFLLGFQSRGEFTRIAVPVAAGKSVFARPPLSQDTLALSSLKLRPISELFIRARDWANRSSI